MRAKRRETLTAQGSGRVAEPYREIVEPIHVATTYERGTDGSYPGGRVYSRADNPTYDAPGADREPRGRARRAALRLWGSGRRGVLSGAHAGSGARPAEHV